MSSGEIVFQPAAFNDLPAAEAVEQVLERVAELNCSDLFFLTDPASVDISVRRLGKFERLATVSLELGRHMINHIKAEAGMDIAESRRPMDGRWLVDVGDHSLDMRINCVATIHGTDMSMRIWNRKAGLLPLHELGMSKSDLQQVTAMLNRPSGLLLITGPTGTGKTTTLYACLDYLNNGDRKINSIEDPVEYVLPGVRQTQVNEKQDLGFAVLLRNLLRQSPDVIMIGEVRDPETATTAIRAAHTGQLVLASLHSPLASSAVHSLIALGVNPYFLSNSLIGVVAQRLIRTLCEHCRVRYDMSDAQPMFAEVADLLGPGEGEAIYGPSGCANCYQTGYSGRTGLYEVMTVNQEIRRLIAEARPRVEIEEAAARAGMVPLRRAALLRVAQGKANTEDILRNVSPELLGIDE